MRVIVLHIDPHLVFIAAAVVGMVLLLIDRDWHGAAWAALAGYMAWESRQSERELTEKPNP